MGRHSAPDDLDEDVDAAVGTVVGTTGDTAVGTTGDAAVGTTGDTDVALAPGGRHARSDRTRPRPSVEDDPPNEGLGLIDDALDEEGEEPVEAPAQVEEPLGPMVVVDAETAQAMILEPIDEPLAPEPAAHDGPEPTARELAVGDAPEPAVHDAPTTEIALADIARLDRPVPEETTAQITPVVDAQAAESLPTAAPQPPGAAPQPPGSAHATRHDLALVMRHGDVRARAAAAVLVPFVVFVVVLAVIGKLEVHQLVWVWAPAIAAGVLVGVVLDAGHKRYPAPPAAAPEPVSEPAGPA